MQYQSLIQEISIVRKNMYALAKQYGYTHPLVVSCSQKLDVLINEYYEKRKAL